MRNLQPADKCKCRNILTVVENLGELTLEEADVLFETVAQPHHDGEEVMVVLLGLLTRGILSEEYFGYLLEVVKGAGWQRTNLTLHFSDWRGR